MGREAGSGIDGGDGKHKIFRDATQGYIQIPAFAVEKLIDTFELQRLKDVAQTGIRPIYSGATHDRFSHSIGVYNIGIKIYESFQKNILLHLSGDRLAYEKAGGLLDEYRPYFYVACILHDIGHPALSHTFEYLYDNQYLKLDNGCAEIGKDEVKRLFELYRKHAGDREKKVELKERLFECLAERSKRQVITDGLKPSQHEMMGAFQILTDCSNLQSLIGETIAQWRGTAGGEGRVDESTIVFIVCMIIGAQYKLPVITEEDKEEKTDAYWERFSLSLRNCVVRLLNGLVDADSIDYLNRNAHFAGYATSNLDVIRLSNAFTAHYDPEQVRFVPCLEKSAMSALEGFISARHFEPRWLYSHHKIIYYEAFLTKYLYKKCARYLYAMECGAWESHILEAFQELEPAFCRAYPLPPAALHTDWAGAIHRFVRALLDVRQEQLAQKAFYYENVFQKPFPSQLEAYFVEAVDAVAAEIPADPYGAHTKLSAIAETARRWVGFWATIREAYQGYVISPIAEFRGVGWESRWYKSSDSDINTLFKRMYLRYKDRAWSELSAMEQEINDRYDLFQEALAEYHTRKYRCSLWKTEEEYHLFLTEVQGLTGLSQGVINEIFVRFIADAGAWEDFDDVMAYNLKDKRKYKAVYLNHKKGGIYGTPAKEFDEMFGFLGMGMIICIYEFHYKDFGRLMIRLRHGESGQLVPYSELTGGKNRETEYLPYIYYKEADSKVDSYGLREKLKKKLVDFLLKRYVGSASQSSCFYPDQGKIIRDSVHGDIFIPDRFLEVIDTKVFQRLRRIKQLATADYVFPGACHSRFAHALGTFHIMTLMLNRICALFDYLHIEYTKTEKDAVLMAALLHDLGHGPYSHAFEMLQNNPKSHEEWTCDIIRNDPELAHIFETRFGKDFSTLVIGCLQHEGGKADRKETLQYVFSSLVSSQLDADRLDYLMRDSLNAGVKFGVIDLQKIIAALELTEYNGELAVCISEDALPSIEQLIVGRFNMYEMVYFTPYKAYSEQLLVNIIERLKESDLPSDSRLYKMMNNTISFEEYVALDDTVIQSELYQYWKDCKDPITDRMIDSLIHRRGYERLRIMDESVAANHTFINALDKTFQIKIADYAAFVYRIDSYCAYTYTEGANTRDGILIVGKNGVVSDAFHKSKIIRNLAGASDARGKTRSVLETVRSCVYVNYDILERELDKVGKKIDVKEIKEFTESYSLRKHTEIEEKYSCSASAIEEGQKLLKALSIRLPEYSVSGAEQEKQQEDTYYDTDDYLLAKSGYSLRCRTLRGGDFIFTVKKSIDPNNGGNDGQFIRSEFEWKAQSPALDGAEAFLAEHLSDLFQQGNRALDVSCFTSKITVKNARKSYDVVRENSNFKCEVSLDTVEYRYHGEIKEDWQVEIELKSQDAIHRTELRNFARKLRQCLKIETDDCEMLSKYCKALKSFGLI